MKQDNTKIICHMNFKNKLIENDPDQEGRNMPHHYLPLTSEEQGTPLWTL